MTVTEVVSEDERAVLACGGAFIERHRALQLVLIFLFSLIPKSKLVSTFFRWFCLNIKIDSSVSRWVSFTLYSGFRLIGSLFRVSAQFSGHFSDPAPSRREDHLGTCLLTVVKMLLRQQ